MKPENYLNVIEKLNSEIANTCEYLYNQGICFEYCSNYYVDLINFAGVNIFNSENDAEIECEKELENILRNKLLIITNGLCTWQHYDGF